MLHIKSNYGRHRNRSIIICPDFLLKGIVYVIHCIVGCAIYLFLFESIVSYLASMLSYVLCLTFVGFPLSFCLGFLSVYYLLFFLLAIYYCDSRKGHKACERYYGTCCKAAGVVSELDVMLTL